MTPLDFRLVEAPIDPCLRERMNDAESYMTPQPLHEVMGGGGAGEVEQSNHPDFVVGRSVLSSWGHRRAPSIQPD